MASAWVRLPEEMVDDDWPRPRLHVETGEEEAVIARLAQAGLNTPIAEQAVWTHKGQQVRNGLFGVEKSGPPLEGPAQGEHGSVHTLQKKEAEQRSHCAK